MKTALLILTILFLLLGIRCINVLQDVVAAVFCGFAAVMFFFFYLNWDNIKENNRLK